MHNIVEWVVKLGVAGEILAWAEFIMMVALAFVACVMKRGRAQAVLGWILLIGMVTAPLAAVMISKSGGPGG